MRRGEFIAVVRCDCGADCHAVGRFCWPHSQSVTFTLGRLVTLAVEFTLAALNLHDEAP
jgi:hypothetical protein